MSGVEEVLAEAEAAAEAHATARFRALCVLADTQDDNGIDAILRSLSREDLKAVVLAALRDRPTDG